MNSPDGKEDSDMMKNANHSKFEFDVGHIAKSPCRDCYFKKDLPGCSENCEKLKRLQNQLIGCVSCSNGFHPLEAYTISLANN